MKVQVAQVQRPFLRRSSIARLPFRDRWFGTWGTGRPNHDRRNMASERPLATGHSAFLVAGTYGKTFLSTRTIPSASSQIVACLTFSLSAQYNTSRPSAWCQCGFSGRIFLNPKHSFTKLSSLFLLAGRKYGRSINDLPTHHPQIMHQFVFEHQPEDLWLHLDHFNDKGPPKPSSVVLVTIAKQDKRIVQ